MFSRNELQVEIPTFDYVLVQFYESFSSLHHAIVDMGIPPAKALTDAITTYLEPWTVDFSNAGVEWNEKAAHIYIPRLVVGLANGWARGSDRALLIKKADLLKTWQSFYNDPRMAGFGFWSILHEGDAGLWLVKELSSFLNERVLGNDL